MLRPATPLAVTLFAAFALLLISVISTPIVKGIKLATFNGVDFGVLGYCQGSQCSGPSVGYSARAFSGGQGNDFSLPTNTRHSLSSLLIVHPIAAFLTLVLFALAAAAHLHSPSHSPRYLLALLILTLPTLLITLLAFLVDILLFVPHLQFGGWLVLAATILIAASGVLTCAMRRTLVSRKARKKRIAENAEMNGENFYGNQPAPPAPPPLSAQPTAPMVNGSPGADKLPQFATFDVGAKGERRASNDDRMPLNPTSPTAQSKNGGFTQGVEMAVIDGSERYGDPRTRAGSEPPNRSRGYTGGRDEFGNPLPPSSAFGGPRRERSDPRLRHQNSDGTLSSPRPGGPPPFGGRGRGGYPPNGRGGRGGSPGGWRGPPPNMPPNNYSNDGSRGGFGGPGMGVGMGPMRGGRGQRGPPPGYGNGYGGGPPTQGGPYGREQSPYANGPRRPSPGPPSAPGYARRPSPGPGAAAGYGRRPSPGPVSAPGYGRRPSGPDPLEENGFEAPPPMPHTIANGAELSRAESPPPLLPPNPQNGPPIVFGQAVEMDATTGSPSPSLNPPAPYNQLRDSDADVRGMVGLQQNRQGSPMRHDSTGMTTSSVYSNGEYVPARNNWAPLNRTGTPPLNALHMPPSRGPETSPVELPTSHVGQSPDHNTPHHTRIGSGDTYYEDVDPRFAEPQVMPPATRSAVPSNLQAGYDPRQNPGQTLHPMDERHPSYEDLHDDSRSPAASDISNYTSISQRGVNPNWHPSMGGEGNVVPRRPMQAPTRERDVLLAGNNDFEIPNARGPGMSRGPRIPGQIPPMAPPTSGGGRYPGPNEI
ncbi:MAG: hypothetical protein M4579_005850 [Chaenotheca gracillima]|nr:MAG: hypothetical protein M4579_005850 [Chaenotheca gracillima]